MIDLLRYYPKFILEAAWTVEPELRIERIHEPGKCIQVIPTGPLGIELCTIGGKHLTEMDRSTTAMAQMSLGKFMRQGPVVIRPALTLCQALLDTEIRIDVRDFKMPFQIMGVELPEAIIGPHYPSLTMVWKPFEDTLYSWTLSPRDLCTYYKLFGPDMSLEERLLRAESCDDQSEYDLQVLGGRIALNLCLLAAHRRTAISELPPRTVRHRRGRDPRLHQLAARDCQELSFRDLVLRDRPGERLPVRGEGREQGKQHRRGHWKRQPYGEKHSLRKLIWLNDYWTHPEQEGGAGAVILQ